MVRIRLTFAFLCVLIAANASAQSVTLAWDASTDPTITGYLVKWGTRSRDYSSSVSVGNRTSWTVTGLVPDQKYYFAVSAVASTGLSSVPSNEVSNDGLIVQTGGQLADQRPTLFWRNGVTGQLETWHVNGTTVVDSRAVNMVSDPQWKVAGTGDMNADGFSDILWRHQSQGWLAYWFMQYNQVVGTGYLSIDRMADANWQVKALGDVDGDKYADLVWQHTDGTLAAWIIRGSKVTSTRLLSIPKVGDARWQIAGVVDTNGDGMADLIWQDPSGGWLAVWYLQGSNVTGTMYLSINRMPDTNWRIQAATVLPGRGPAIVWRHLTEGSVATWTLRGNVVTGTYFFNPGRVDNLDWNIVGGR